VTDCKRSGANQKREGKEEKMKAGFHLLLLPYRVSLFSGCTGTRPPTAASLRGIYMFHNAHFLLMF
jgi:hypothetical protein